MGDKELLNRARNDKSAKESELSFTNPVNYALKQNNSKAPGWKTSLRFYVKKDVYPSLLDR